jgi:hypothetical protein
LAALREALAGVSRIANTGEWPLEARGEVISRAGAVRSLSKCVGVVGSKKPDEVDDRLAGATVAAADFTLAPAAQRAEAAMSAVSAAFAPIAPRVPTVLPLGALLEGEGCGVGAASVSKEAAMADGEDGR